MYEDKINALAEMAGIDVRSDIHLREKIKVFSVLLNFERTRELMPLIKELIIDEMLICASICDDMDHPDLGSLVRSRISDLHIDGDILAVRQAMLDRAARMTHSLAQ